MPKMRRSCATPCAPGLVEARLEPQPASLAGQTDHDLAPVLLAAGLVAPVGLAIPLLDIENEQLAATLSGVVGFETDRGS